MVGITGGIAEGKSTVLGILRDAGYSVASADEAARQVLSDPEIAKVVATAAGLRYPFERIELRDRLARDPAVRRRVNSVLHPLIRDQLAVKNAQFVEIPLLIEDCLQDQFEEIWVVTCGPQEQLSRLNIRTGSESASRALLAMQLPTSAKLPFADRIVRTNQSRTRVKVSTLHAATQAILRCVQR